MPPQNEPPTTPIATDTDEEEDAVTFTGGSVMYGTLSRTPGGQYQTMDSWEPIYRERGRGGSFIQGVGSPVRSVHPEPLDISISSSPLSPGFTNEDIRAWASGRLCSIPPRSERQIIEALARIIVREVLS